MYKQSRNYENLNKRIFEGVGPFDIPQLQPAVLPPSDINWLGFNYARGCDEPEIHGVHFFLDDYQFQRVWTQPDSYLNMLRRFGAVCTPDFSMYTDFPRAVQVYNHYRKHWLGAYWQAYGVKIIPTISWSDRASFDWCFDGEPVGGCVIVSSVGTQASRDTRELFLDGYREMICRLHPDAVLFYGDVPDACEGNIIHIRPFRPKYNINRAPTN